MKIKTFTTLIVATLLLFSCGGGNRQQQTTSETPKAVFVGFSQSREANKEAADDNNQQATEEVVEDNALIAAVVEQEVRNTQEVTRQFNILPPIHRWRYDLTTVDSVTTRILYALNAIDSNDPSTFVDLQRLEIGANLSKFYSYFTFRNDSLIADFFRRNPRAGGFQQMGEFGRKGNVWLPVIWYDTFKNFSENTLTVFANTPHGIPNFQYTERLPTQNWQLYDETRTIMGYLCQKATTRFRGRDFVAWFAPEIPISNGPWKFGGLPGLILKVYDTDKHFVFEAIKIERHRDPFPMKMFDPNRYRITDRTTLRQLDKDIHRDFFTVGEMRATDRDGNPVQFTPIPFYPLELE